MIGLFLLVLIFVLFFMGIPVYLALGAAGAAGLLLLNGNPLTVIPQSIFGGVSFFPLLAIPFFVFAGELMNKGGITDRLVRFAMMLIGRAPASLANADVLACMFFGGVTGSSQADTSAIGSVLIPAMVKEGYSPGFSAAVTTAASTCGPIIPPSIMMVIYGVVVEQSIGQLFLAGVVPGILIAVGLMATVSLLNLKHHYPRRTEPIPFRNKVSITVQAIVPLGMPVIIVGGILGGVVTATEAGALAVVYSLIVGFLVLKTLKVTDLAPMLLKTAILTSAILMIISCAKILGWVFAEQQVQVVIGHLFLSISHSPLVYFALINVLLLIVGMFMDGGASIIILAPILAPIAVSLGINPIHFGLVMVLNLVIGAGTPPLAVCLFIACGIAKIPVETGARAIGPFLVAEIAVLALVTYVPDLSLFLSRVLGYS